MFADQIPLNRYQARRLSNNLSWANNPKPISQNRNAITQVGDKHNIRKHPNTSCKLRLRASNELAGRILS